MKKSLLILLGLTVAVQLWVPASMILKHERVLREGMRVNELFRLRTQPFDPADPFQGRYVWLQFINDYIPGENEKENAPEWREKAEVMKKFPKGLIVFGWLCAQFSASVVVAMSY